MCWAQWCSGVSVVAPGCSCGFPTQMAAGQKSAARLAERRVRSLHEDAAVRRRLRSVPGESSGQHRAAVGRGGLETAKLGEPTPAGRPRPLGVLGRDQGAASTRQRRVPSTLWEAGLDSPEIKYIAKLISQDKRNKEIGERHPHAVPPMHFICCSCCSCCWLKVYSDLASHKHSRTKK